MEASRPNTIFFLVGGGGGVGRGTSATGSSLSLQALISFHKLLFLSLFIFRLSESKIKLKKALSRASNTQNERRIA